MVKRFSLILTLIFFSLSTQSFAQEAKHVLGLKAGPSYNFIYGLKEIQGTKKPVYLFSAGLSYQYNFNSRLSLLTGLGYDLKGDNQYYDFTDAEGKVLTTFTFKRRLSYLVIPIQGRVYFGEKLKFFLNTGAYAALALNHTGNVEVEEQLIERTLLHKYTRPIDLGIVTGAGLELPVSSALDISLELRNNLGLTDWRKQAYTTKDPVRLNSLSLLAGLSYKLGNTSNPAN